MSMTEEGALLLGGLPLGSLVDMSATTVCIIVFFMVMRGTLATPRHQRDLRETITDQKSQLIHFLEIIKEQRDIIRILTENLRTVEQLAGVVGHTMETIKAKREGDSQT